MQNPSRRSSRLAKKAAAAPSSSTQIPTTTVTPKPQPPSSSSSSAGQANPKPPTTPKPQPPSSSAGQYYVKANPNPKTPKPPRNPKPNPTPRKGLLEKKVEPQDDVHAQMPSAMLERRRLNGKDKNHVVFTKNKPEDGAGRIGGLSAARWVQSPSVGVFSLNGIKVGDHTSFTLVFTDKNGTRDGKWKMDLFVSVDCVARDSAIAVLKCSHSAWDLAEVKVQRAESKLREAYATRKSICESQRDLGLRISELQSARRRVREHDEVSAGAGVVDGSSTRGASSGSSSAVHLSAVVAPDREEDSAQPRHLSQTVPHAPSRDP